MAKLTLTDLTDLSNETSVVNNINNNNSSIETAMENTLSRDGTTPNTMEADFDMNGNRIINLPAASSNTEPVRQKEWDAWTTSNALATGERERLSANRIYYVDFDTGDDTLSGLTEALAFKTLGQAIDIIFETLDLNGYTVTVECSGTSTTGVTIQGPNPGVGVINIYGNTTASITTPSATINTTSDDVFEVTGGAIVTIRGFITSTTTSGHVLNVNDHAIVTYGNIEFGTCADDHVQVSTNATALPNWDYEITGNADRHFATLGYSNLVASSLTMTLTGTPAFATAFVETRIGEQNLESITFSGSATGKRFLSRRNGTIFVGSSGTLTSLPGDTAGTRETGGKYVYGTGTQNDVIAPETATDNALVKVDGTGEPILQETGIVVDDSDNVTGLGNITSTGTEFKIDSTGLASIVLDGGASDWEYIDFLDNGTRRWILGAHNSTDDFSLLRYNSSGAFQETTLSIDESTGLATFNKGVTITGGNLDITDEIITATSSSSFYQPIRMYSTATDANAGPYIIFGS
jgi:hypothetical protein